MPLKPSHPRTSLRPASFDPDSGDLPFLRDLYASTRREEMALTGWPQNQIDAFLRQQFEAQHAHHARTYPGASLNLILVKDAKPASEICNLKSEIGNQKAGRLYLHESDHEFRVIDIALVPGWRGQGIGRRLMRDILAVAGKRGKAVSLHVDPANPATHLYRRLGFRQVDSDGIRLLMQWTSAKPALA